MAKKKKLVAEIEKLESEIKWLKDNNADMRFALRSIVFDKGNKSYVIARWKGIFHIAEQLEKARWKGLQHLGDGLVKITNDDRGDSNTIKKGVPKMPNHPTMPTTTEERKKILRGFINVRRDANTNISKDL